MKECFVTVMIVCLLVIGNFDNNKLAFSQQQTDCQSSKAEQVEWSHNGGILAMQEPTIIFFDQSHLDVPNFLEIDTGTDGIAWSPDDLFLATTFYNFPEFYDARIALIEEKSQKVTAQLFGFGTNPTHMAIDWNENNLIAVASTGASDVISEPIWTIKIWDTSEGSTYNESDEEIDYYLPIYQVDPSYEKITDIAWEPNANRLARALASGQIDILDVENNQILLSMQTGSFIYKIAWHPDRSIIAFTNHREVKFWDINTNTLTTFTSLESNAADIEWSYTGDALATGDVEGNLVVWDTETAKILYQINENSPIVNLDWNPSGQLITVVYQDDFVCTWDVS